MPILYTESSSSFKPFKARRLDIESEKKVNSFSSKILQTVHALSCLYDVLCQREVADQYSQSKTDTIQKMLDQVTREYYVSRPVFYESRLLAMLQCGRSQFVAFFGILLFTPVDIR